MKQKTTAIKNIVYPELEAKLLAFLRLVARSSDFAEQLKTTLADFDTLFSNKNAYRHILKTAHLLSDDDRHIQILPLQDPSTFRLSFFVPATACSPLFKEYLAFNARANNFGLAEGKVNVEAEYCLLLDMKGETTAIIFHKDKKLDTYNFCNNFEILVLDLPLIMYGLINGPTAASTKLALATLAEKNPVSTFANIFSYIKANGKALAALPKKLNLLEKEIATLFLNLENNRTDNSFIGNNIRKEFGYIARVHLPPYTISLEAGEMSIKATNTKENLTDYNFRNYEEVFPAVITIKGNSCTPYFLRNEFFHNEAKGKKLGEKLYCLKKNKGLISLSEKIEELCSLEQAKTQASYNNLDDIYKEYGQYIARAKLKNGRLPEKFLLPNLEDNEVKAFRKTITEQLNKNLELVLATLEKHIVYCSNEALFHKQEKFLLKTQSMVTNCKKRAEAIAGTLGKIYKNEIVLENL
jgi:hypothetical protein